MSRLKWKGDECADKARRAGRLALVRFGIGVIGEALPNTPIENGTLRRSEHVAEPNADHSADFDKAQKGQALHATPPDEGRLAGGKGRVVAQLGSWLKYALRQELRHKTMSGFLMGSIDRCKRNMPGLLKQAWAEVVKGG